MPIYDILESKANALRLSTIIKEMNLARNEEKKKETTNQLSE